MFFSELEEFINNGQAPQRPEQLPTFGPCLSSILPAHPFALTVKNQTLKIALLAAVRAGVL